MKNVLKSFILLFAVANIHGYSQENNEIEKQYNEPTRSAEPVLEEIVVTGFSQKKIRELKKQLLDSQKKMFLLFNQLNGDKSLDILCRYRRRPGTSMIKVRVCSPAYLLNAISAQTQLALVGVYSNHIPGIQAKKGPQMEAARARLIDESEEYREAVEKYGSLQLKLQDALD